MSSTTYRTHQDVFVMQIRFCWDEFLKMVYAGRKVIPGLMTGLKSNHIPKQVFHYEGRVGCSFCNIWRPPMNMLTAVLNHPTCLFLNLFRLHILCSLALSRITSYADSNQHPGRFNAPDTERRFHRHLAATNQILCTYLSPGADLAGNSCPP